MSKCLESNTIMIQKIIYCSRPICLATIDSSSYGYQYAPVGTAVHSGSVAICSSLWLLYSFLASVDREVLIIRNQNL